MSKNKNILKDHQVHIFLEKNYSIYVDNRALDNSSFLLIVQNLVCPEWNGLSYSKILLVNRSGYSG